VHRSDFPVYGSNNWYYAYGDSSEEEILSDTDYILKLTEGVKNPPFMVIDDCWQEHHRLDEYNGGPWTKGNSKFPDMKGLAQKLVEKGVRPGIWVRLLLNEDEAIPDEWRISYNDCLDPSHPDALAYIRKDIERICDWGFTLIKHDFSTFDLFGKWGFEANLRDNTMEKWHFYDQGKTSAEIVKMLYQEVYDASRSNNAIIIGCNTIGHLGAGLMHLNRTGDDTSGRIWERTKRMGVNTLAFRLPQHNTFYHIDADCVGIFGKIPWDKNLQWADLLAKSGTPLFVSAMPGALNPEEFEELHQIMLIASEQKEHFVPLDWEETDCPEIWGENGETVTYDWYDDEGPTMDATVEYYNAKVVVP
jgi:alpha-galactosidase